MQEKFYKQWSPKNVGLYSYKLKSLHATLCNENVLSTFSVPWYVGEQEKAVSASEIYNFIRKRAFIKKLIIRTKWHFKKESDIMIKTRSISMYYNSL